MTFWTGLQALPFRLAVCDAGGIPTRYLEAGPDAGSGARTVIFLHGVNGHLEVFAKNVAAHAAEYRVLALDLLGHGYTGKPDHDYEIAHYIDHVLAFMDAAGVDRASLVGTSLGGWISARIAAQAPERVETLSLVSSGGLTAYTAVMDKLRTLGTQAAAATKGADDDGRAAVRARLEFVIKDKALVSEELVEARWRIYQQPDYKAALPHILCLQDMEVRARNLLNEEELAQITARTLVLWTEDDPTATLADGKRYADAIPGARFEVFNKSSHMPQFEEPERFNALHLTFLRGEA